MINTNYRRKEEGEKKRLGKERDNWMRSLIRCSRKKNNGGHRKISLIRSSSKKLKRKSLLYSPKRRLYKKKKTISLLIPMFTIKVTQICKNTFYLCSKSLEDNLQLILSFSESMNSFNILMFWEREYGFQPILRTGGLEQLQLRQFLNSRKTNFLNVMTKEKLETCSVLWCNSLE